MAKNSLGIIWEKNSHFLLMDLKMFLIGVKVDIKFDRAQTFDSTSRSLQTTKNGVRLHSRTKTHLQG